MKLVLISIVILFAVLTFVFILFPNHIQVSRIQSVAARQEKIMGIIERTGDWNRWNRFAINANQQHAVTFEIISKTNNAFSTRWTKTGGRSFTGNFVIMPSGNENIVQWTLDFPLRWYPWERLSGMFYEKQLGPLMDESLSQLKKLAEHE